MMMNTDHVRGDMMAQMFWSRDGWEMEQELWLFAQEDDVAMRLYKVVKQLAHMREQLHNGIVEPNVFETAQRAALLLHAQASRLPAAIEYPEALGFARAVIIRR